MNLIKQNGVTVKVSGWVVLRQLIVVVSKDIRARISQLEVLLVRERDIDRDGP